VGDESGELVFEGTVREEEKRVAFVVVVDDAVK